LATERRTWRLNPERSARLVRETPSRLARFVGLRQRGDWSNLRMQRRSYPVHSSDLGRVDRAVVQPDCRWTRDASVSNQVDIGTLARSRVPLGKMTTIKRIRVFAAIAFAGLFLQLILAGSGFACVIPTASHGGDGAMASGATMVGMEMPASDQSIPASPDETPCHLPWAPAGCQPMAPCSPAVMTSPAVTFDSPPSVVEGVSRHTVIAPPTRTVPPELPPPRV
jgi:hypothetical protein